jgi:DNA-binding transcriptional regulator LsrR (DeoR family)
VTGSPDLFPDAQNPKNTDTQEAFMPRPKRERFSDEVIAAVCSRFMKCMPYDQIAKEVQKEIRANGNPDFELSRQRVYRVLEDAINSGFFFYSPPSHTALARRISETFAIPEDRIHVARSRLDVEEVAAKAAEVALKRIRGLDKKEVHLGFAAGGSAMRVARQLGGRLRQFETSLELGIHAMSIGVSNKHTLGSPISFFAFFESPEHKTEFVGLECTPVVADAKGFDALQEQPGVRAAFEAAGSLDLVITSLCGADDEDGDLARASALLVSHSGDDGLDYLRRQNWVGEVMGRPYNSEGPIDETGRMRIVTLFSIEQLVEFASRERKHVILVAGPCFACGKSREESLLPLLRSPALKLWTDLVLDVDTAGRLLRLAEGESAASDGARAPRGSPRRRDPARPRPAPAR